MASFSIAILSSLAERAAFCRIPTGSAIQDSINQDWLAFATSPNSSDVQEKILVEACGGHHKGGKKLGADGGLDGVDLEAKPSKATKPTYSSKLKRLEGKSKRSTVKSGRGRVKLDD